MSIYAPSDTDHLPLTYSQEEVDAVSAALEEAMELADAAVQRAQDGLFDPRAPLVSEARRIRESIGEAWDTMDCGNPASIEANEGVLLVKLPKGMVPFLRTLLQGQIRSANAAKLGERGTLKWVHKEEERQATVHKCASLLDAIPA